MIADIHGIAADTAAATEDLPVPVLVSPHTISPLDEVKAGNGEARESTEAGNNAVECKSHTENPDSRGGQKNSTQPTPRKLSGLQGKKARGRPRLPENQLSYDARRMRRVYEQRAVERDKAKRKGRGVRFESGRQVCGTREVGIKVLSDFQVDVAIRAFWTKRGMSVPSATMGGILPSVSDFNEEVTILQMRTCL